MQLFLSQMGNQSSRPSDNRNATQCRDGESCIEQHCGNGARYVHRQLTAKDCLRLAFDFSEGGAVRTGDSQLVGEFKQPRCPGISVPMDRMTEAR